MTPETCLKFSKCNANVCPLDPDWRLRTHIRDERVCFYAREAGKEGGENRLKSVLGRELASAIVSWASGARKSRWHPLQFGRGDIARQLDNSARSGSRLAPFGAKRPT